MFNYQLFGTNININQYIYHIHTYIRSRLQIICYYIENTHLQWGMRGIYLKFFPSILHKILSRKCDQNQKITDEKRDQNQNLTQSWWRAEGNFKKYVQFAPDCRISTEDHLNSHQDWTGFLSCLRLEMTEPRRTENMW